MQLTIVRHRPQPRPQLELDELADRVHVIETAVTTDTAPLTNDPPTGPGAYLLMYAGNLACYQRLRHTASATGRSIVEAGGYPLYAGSARDLTERTRRHRHKLTTATNLAPDDLSIITLHTQFAAGAVYVEAILIEEFRPTWNEPWMAGFGSKAQGHVRTAGQRTPPWDRLHRSTTLDRDTDTDTDVTTELEQRITAHLETTVPACTRRPLAN